MYTILGKAIVDPSQHGTSSILNVERDEFIRQKEGDRPRGAEGDHGRHNQDVEDTARHTREEGESHREEGPSDSVRCDYESALERQERCRHPISSFLLGFDFIRSALKTFLRNTEIPGALFALKRKKLYEAEVSKLQGAKITLESQINALESAVVNIETFYAMNAGKNAMKTIRKDMLVPC